MCQHVCVCASVYEDLTRERACVCMHRHMHIYNNYIYMCVCVCVCVCTRARERERVKERARERNRARVCMNMHVCVCSRTCMCTHLLPCSSGHSTYQSSTGISPQEAYNLAFDQQLQGSHTCPLSPKHTLIDIHLPSRFHFSCVCVCVCVKWVEGGEGGRCWWRKGHFPLP